MKICIANPPAYFGDHTRHFIQAGSRWSFSMDAPWGNHKWPHYQPFPFSLAYATSILKYLGFEVEAFDGCALDMDGKEFRTRVDKIDPDVLITEIPTVSFDLMGDLLEYMRCSAIAIAGSHITWLGNIRPYLCLKGEWDGLYPNNRFKDFPYPDRESFPNEQYSNFEFYRPSAQVLTSRGCPHGCSFCLERWVTHGSPTVDCRPPGDVVDEVIDLASTGVRQIWFDDAELTPILSHVDGLCQEFIARKPGIPWTCFGDVLAHPKTIKQMARAGCIGMAFGVETITPEALKLVNKAWITPERLREFTKLLRSEGIHSHASYAIGLPGETRGSILDMIKFALELETDSLQFSIATPFPGTPFFELCRKEGWLLNSPWDHYDGSRYCVVDYPQLKHEETEELFRYAMKRREELNLGFRK